MSVFSNGDCVSEWARQGSDYGRNKNGSIFFNGKTIYSYGDHFPMGHFISLRRVLLNPATYSSTTSKHQNLVTMATTNYDRLWVEDVLADDSKAHKANLTEIRRGMTSSVLSYFRARSRKDDHLRSLTRSVESFQTYCDWFKGKIGNLPKELRVIRDFSPESSEKHAYYQELFALFGKVYQTPQQSEAAFVETAINRMKNAMASV